MDLWGSGGQYWEGDERPGGVCPNPLGLVIQLYIDIWPYRTPNEIYHYFL